MKRLGTLLMGIGVALIIMGLVLVAPSANAAETIAGNRMDFTQANFREIFARDDGRDPYPGEDLIYYCNLAGSTATQIAWARAEGKSREIISNSKIVEKPERQATLDIVRWVFERPSAKPGIKMYLEVAQWCLNARLAATWYTYNWKSDPDYPKYINPATQTIIEF